MKFSKLLLAAVFAFVMTAGALMAADEPLEIHGGGRIGFVVNSKLGSAGKGSSIDNNRTGKYPNHGETNYYSLWFSKKTTAESGAWAKVTFGIDNFNCMPTGDLAEVTWRLRGFNVEFGALDFLPQGSTLKAGLFGLNQGWNDNQDMPCLNMNGIGIGLANLGGIAGIYYLAQDATTLDDKGAIQTAGSPYNNEDDNPKLGERTMHVFAATVNNPMIDFLGGVGYAKKADNPGEKNLVNVAAGVVVKLPVAGLNVHAEVATNSWATEMIFAADDTVLKATDLAPGTVDQAKKYKATAVRAGFFSIYDLGEGMYVAPAMFYSYFKAGKDYENTRGGTADQANSDIEFSCKFSKALTQNIAFAPALGYSRQWTDASGNKAQQYVKATVGVEMGLNTGYWAGQKVQVYASYENIDKDHKNSVVWDDNRNRMHFGTYVTFGF